MKGRSYITTVGVLVKILNIIDTIQPNVAIKCLFDVCNKIITLIIPQGHIKANKPLTIFNHGKPPELNAIEFKKLQEFKQPLNFWMILWSHLTLVHYTNGSSSELDNQICKSFHSQIYNHV